ncbi:hypothetical protein [Streptomyces sp. DT2A-34]|uniref:hypothetical protein n=1 Tax=Streptomyces sp. DT2A-34 TaxID=3051182 RepID=UPI00346429FF
MTGRAGRRLLGSGRACDVYEIDEAWVLRLDREGYSDSLAEAALMERLRPHGYPVPRVRLADSSRSELVMERLYGPTMLEAFVAGRIDASEGGDILARLLRQLHAGPGRVVHLGLGHVRGDPRAGRPGRRAVRRTRPRDARHPPRRPHRGRPHGGLAPARRQPDDDGAGGRSAQ